MLPVGRQGSKLLSCRTAAVAVEPRRKATTNILLLLLLFAGIATLISFESQANGRPHESIAPVLKGKTLEQQLVIVDDAWHDAVKRQSSLQALRASLLQLSREGPLTSRGGVLAVRSPTSSAPPAIALPFYSEVAGPRACSSVSNGLSNSCRRRSGNVESKLPKVYVYDLPAKFNSDLSEAYRRCITDQYGTEITFHVNLLQCPCRVDEPSHADLFFVPIYGECFLWSHEMLRHEGHDDAFAATDAFYLEALDIVREELPFWNYTGGRDHVFVFAGARGPTIFQSWRTEIANSIFLTPEGDRTLPYFNTWKDIVIPGLEADPAFTSASARAALIARDASTPRTILAHFRGTIYHPDGWVYSKGLRPRLAELFANVSDIVYDGKTAGCDRACYREEISRSVFCLNPLGWSPWTLRFYQAIMMRCIPVVIADNIEFPYEDWVDYSQFVLKIPEREVDNLVQIMRDVPEVERARKREYMDSVWHMFAYQKPAQPGDAFYTVLQQVSKKVHATPSDLLSW